MEGKCSFLVKWCLVIVLSSEATLDIYLFIFLRSYESEIHVTKLKLSTHILLKELERFLLFASVETEQAV